VLAGVQDQVVEAVGAAAAERHRAGRQQTARTPAPSVTGTRERARGTADGHGRDRTRAGRGRDTHAPPCPGRRGSRSRRLASADVSPRRCTRTACSATAVATLTYAYADSTAVVGPLAPYREPHTYDLCESHAQKTTAPRGWSVLRVEDPAGPHQRSADDLEALADAVREAARPHHPVGPGPSGPLGRRGHLRALPTP
jgi:hypothetical protein